jgi:hypothetical protein
MSIVAVHGPNTMGSKARVANISGTAYATVNPANGLIWTFYPKDQSQVAANYDWAYTPTTGTPASPIADTKTPTVTFSAPGTYTVTLTLNGVAQAPITVKAVSGVAPKLTGDEEAPPEESLEPHEAATPPEEFIPEAEELYDPGDHTIEEVMAYATAHPDEVVDIYNDEVEGKARSTLLSQLEALIPFDPADHTVTEVIGYVEENPDQLDEVLAAERIGKNRSTLINQLEGMRTA